VKRRTFALSLLAAAGSPRIARATGGLDVEDALVSRSVRVLLASGDGFPAPERAESWYFAWNGRTYRGSYAVVTLENGRRGLVNTVPLDAYLYGVLGAEISAAWPSAAQEAQAVAARTFVLTKLRPARTYDVAAGDNDQSYGGIDAESVEGRAAVDATSGRILTYAGNPAHVCYSACCGGRTADAGDVWGTSYAYLSSRPDPNCANAPEFAWRSEIAYATLKEPLALDEIGALRSVALRGLDASGRPRALTFAGANATLDVPTRTFRSAAGGGVVHSTFIRSVELNARGEVLAISGTGRGHGVGLCQWGARGMAANGAGSDEILAFYFPGTAFGRA
jgi:stage II sporulation protein D